MNDKLTIIVRYTTKSGLAKTFSEEVLKLGILPEIRKEDGCEEYSYYLSAENPSEVVLLERWASEEKQIAHLAGKAMEKLRLVKDKYVVSQMVEKFNIRK